MFLERFANVLIKSWKRYFYMFSECWSFFYIWIFIGYMKGKETFFFSFCKHYGDVTFECSLKIPKQITFKKMKIQLKHFRKKKYFKNNEVLKTLLETR